MRLLSLISTVTLFLVSTALALPRPHFPSSSSLLPRQEDQGLPNDGRPLLRNTGLVIQQSDFDKDGNLKPAAERRRQANADRPIFDFGRVDCEPWIGTEGVEKPERSAMLEEQVRELCAELEDRTQA